MALRVRPEALVTPENTQVDAARVRAELVDGRWQTRRQLAYAMLTLGEIRQ